MKLYTFFRASAPYRMRIALNLKGIDYDPVYVSLPGSEHHQSGYAAVNPQKLLPALVDGDTVLIQSLATMEYLEETHPEPPLLPKDPSDRAYVRALALMVACEMHPLNNLRTLKYLENTLGCDADAKDVAGTSDGAAKDSDAGEGAESEQDEEEAVPVEVATLTRGSIEAVLHEAAANPEGRARP